MNLDRAGNSDKGIHNREYEREFLNKPITYFEMISDCGRDKESLNGLWNFQVDSYDTCLRQRWFEEKYTNENGKMLPFDFDFDAWKQVRVPSCWNLQDEKLFYFEGSAVYTREFKYYSRGEKKVFIKFGAANYDAKIFLNRKLLGYHKGGSTPFYIEVSGALRETNRLIIVVNNTRKSDSVPEQNYDWFNYGGLYRDVELIRLPETFIKRFTLTLLPGSGCKRARIHVSADGSRMNDIAKLTIKELGICEEIMVTNGEGSKTIEAEPELWCPENPKLYDVELTYAGDRVCDKIGFREVRVEGTDLLLNGKKLFLKGVSCHEESVVNGKAVSEEEIYENIRLAKEMNCNFMRLAHYPHTEKAAKLADQLGILLWEEIPVYWAIDFDNTATYQDAENQLAELIIRDYNRASVIIWSVGNENADTDSRYKFMSSLADKAKEMDPTRLVSAACLVDHNSLVLNDRLAKHLDVIGINEYYGWYDPDIGKLSLLLDNNSPAKPVIISEFGADASAGERGAVSDLCSEDCQREIYQKTTARLRLVPYVCGLTPWILYDFRSPRRTNRFEHGYNIKGLLSADKKYRKQSFYVMQEFYRDLRWQ